MNKARLESFSDGVFAFAITLLVLGVQIPELKKASEPELRQALIGALPQLVPYITSFVTIGTIWLNHHAMFHLVKRVEHITLTLNLFLLLIVAFIPFPTAVLSKYGPLPSSAFLYGCVLTLLGFAYSLLWLHIVKSRLSGETTEQAATGKIARNLVGSLTYPSAAVLALWHPRISVAIYLILTIFYFVPGLRGTRKGSRPNPEGGSSLALSDQ